MSILGGGAVAAAGTHRLTLGTYVANGTGVTTASAGIKVLNNGQLHTGDSSVSTTPAYADVGGDEWHADEAVGVGDDYEVRLTLSSGALDVGIAGAWLALTSDRAFEVNVTAPGSSSAVGTLEIRRAGGNVLVSGSVTLGAQGIGT